MFLEMLLTALNLQSGTYYVKLWNNQDLNTDPDLMTALNQLNKTTDTSAILELQKNLQK